MDEVTVKLGRKAPIAACWRAPAVRTVPSAWTTPGCTVLARVIAPARVTRCFCGVPCALTSTAPPSSTSPMRSALRLPTAIASPFRLRLPEAGLALHHRDIARLLRRREQRADLGADRLALRLELRADYLPERIHRLLVPVEHRLDAVALCGGELELFRQMLVEARATAVAVP